LATTPPPLTALAGRGEPDQEETVGGSAGDPGDSRRPAFDPEAPITVEVLADLQAGLLDDDAAAHVRRRVRNDEALARQLTGLDQVRRQLALLSADAPSAPEVPPAVTERIVAALRAANDDGSPVPGHAVRGARMRPRVVVATTGVLAAIAAAGIGTAMLVRPADPARSEGPTAETISVSRPPSPFPLSQPALVDLLGQPPDLGPLADPQRRSSCLAGLGYSTSTRVLGAKRILAGGQPLVVLLVPGSAPKAVNALVVRPNCSSADTGLLADTALNQP
jgi:hypothetical protein